LATARGAAIDLYFGDAPGEFGFHALVAAKCHFGLSS
jgi:hypothetical protein